MYFSPYDFIDFPLSYTKIRVVCVGTILVPIVVLRVLGFFFHQIKVIK